MRSRFFFAACAYVVLATTFPAYAAPASVLTAPRVSTDELRTYMIERYRALPGVAGVTVQDDGRIVVKLRGKGDIYVSLDNLLDLVNTPGEDRKARIAEFVELVHKTARTARGDGTAAAIGPVFPILKPEGFTDTSGLPGLSGKQPTFISRAVVSGLVMLVARDDRSFFLLKEGEGEKQGLSDEELTRRAMNALTAKAARARVGFRNGTGRVDIGPNYTSSMIVYRPFWEAQAARLGGPLIVAVPSRALVVFALASDSSAVAIVRRAAEVEGEAYPVTKRLLRWDGGWSWAF